MRAGGLAQTPIPRDRLRAGVPETNVPYPWIMTIGDAGFRVLRRSVVRDHKLELSIYLSEHAVDCFTQQGAAIGFDPTQ